MLINYGSCIFNIAQSTIDTCTLTVNPTPSNAEVSLVAPDCTQIGNQIQVPKNTPVLMIVFLENYVPQSDLFTVSSDTTLDINLQTGVLLTVNPNPADAEVYIIYRDVTYPFDHLTLPVGETVEVEIHKQGYIKYKQTITVTEDTTLNIDLEPLQPVDVDGYRYHFDEDQNIILDEYIGSNTDIIVPSPSTGE